MQMILEPELVGSLHFFPYIGQGANIMANVDYLKFWPGYRLTEMALVSLDEPLYIGLYSGSYF